MKFWLESSLILVSLLAACIPEPVNKPSFEPHECWVDASEGLIVDCLTVPVPEDHSQPLRKDNAIQLAVAIIHPSSSDIKSDPVFILSGGPGEPTVHLIKEWDNFRLAPILKNRDVVLVDQRGTGYSNPNLNCFEDNISACRSRLIDQGIKLSTYTTTNNAADFNDVRIALGYEKINLLAGSYGTHLGLSILRDYPEGVRSAVLDGVVPPQIHLDPEMMRVFAHSLKTLFADCAADPACQAAFPELEQDLYRLVPNLDEKPVKVRSGNTDQTVDGTRFMNILFEALHHSQTLTYLPCLISCTVHGDYEVLEAFVKAFSGSSGNQTQTLEFDYMSEGMQYSILCAEEVAYQTEGEFRSAALDFDESIRGIVLENFNYYTRICETWDVPRGPDKEEQPANSDIPVLLLSGKYDPSTSYTWAQLAAKTLSHHYLYALPDTGHVTWRTSNCAIEIISQFINDPSSDPTKSCLSDLRPPAFVTEQ